MKIAEFTKIMRKVIREEVRAAVKAELNDALKPKKQNTRKVIDHGLTLHESVEKVDKKRFAKNSMLNDILNETAEKSKPIPQMGNKTFTSQDAVGGLRSKFAEAMDPQADFGAGGVAGKPTADEMIPEDKKHVPIPDYIQNALTKDYSQLVKTMTKKK